MRPGRSSIATLCVLFFTLALSSGYASGATRASGLTIHRVDPSATSPTVGAPDNPNIAIVDPAVRSNGELFVFLPGTGGQPACCTYLLEAAAEAGFHAIGLTYANATAVGAICRNNLACYATVRQDDFDGSKPNPYVNVAATNAIQARLADLLRYLGAHDPSEGWSQFVTGNTPVWKRIVVAGHSQGGGDAAYIAKIRKVEGVVMLSSDVDSSSTSPPVAAPYLTSGHLTPLGRYVGFDHVRDVFFTKITTDWAALDLQSFGPRTSIDGRRTPFGNTHELVTSAPVPSGRTTGLAAHGSTAVDRETPLCKNGTPAFAPVWRYMMQIAGGLPVTKDAPVCAGAGGG